MPTVSDNWTDVLADWLALATACAALAGIVWGAVIRATKPLRSRLDEIHTITTPKTATNQAATATNVAATATNQAKTATNQAAGGGLAHNNMQPTILLNYIIRALGPVPTDL